MRNLQQNSCAVARAGIAPLRAAMGQVFQDLEPLLDDLMGLLAFDVDDKADPAANLFRVEGRRALVSGGKPGMFIVRIS